MGKCHTSHLGVQIVPQLRKVQGHPQSTQRKQADQNITGWAGTGVEGRQEDLRVDHLRGRGLD